ncbi:Solute Carrier Family 2, Facilitated Glucose Transporter Member 9 [Manis pentadactyla]|nr:Solute Carrier Family 2, Facilitated Glucose Transporter Member 9 [Manis pentadactyla]
MGGPRGGTRAGCRGRGGDGPETGAGPGRSLRRRREGLALGQAHRHWRTPLLSSSLRGWSTSCYVKEDCLSTDIALQGFQSSVSCSSNLKAKDCPQLLCSSGDRHSLRQGHAHIHGLGQ